MSDRTKIEWTDASWNTIGGCTRVGKKRAGRLLDGREWNEMPGALT